MKLKKEPLRLRRARSVRLGVAMGLFLAALAADLASPAAAAVAPHRLTFASGCCLGTGSVFVVDADGRNAREIVSENSGDIVDPSWSPDGTKIAYTKLSFIGPAAQGTAVHVVGADGSNDRVVASFSSAFWAMETAWSPRGDRISFTLMQLPSYWGAGRVFSKIFVVAPDGSGLRPLTPEPAYESCAAWSPDGRRIAFASSREGVGGVYVMRPDGVSVPQRVTPLEVNAGCPVWSPDGRRIAFTGSRLTDNIYANPTIWVVDADGGHPIRLPAATWTKPSWSPDGKWLAYQFRGVHIVRSDGSAIRHLTSAPGPDVTEYWASWSPDGRSIAFVRSIFRDELRSGVWSIRPDGRGQRLLVGGTGANGPLDWSRRR